MYQQYIELGVALLIAVAISGALRLTYKRIFSKLVDSPRIWDDARCKALYSPLHYIIWGNYFIFSAKVVSQWVPDVQLTGVLEPLRVIGTTFCVVWIIARFIQHLETNWSQLVKNRKHSLDKTTLRAITQLVRLASMIIGVLISLQTLGIPLSGVIAFGGISGIAIGFAAKDMLANFFGGLMIFFDRPFAIGDWIRSPDRDIQGTVEHIGWRLTRIRTFDKRPLYIPNGVFSSISIENPSRMQNRRIKAQIGVRYEDADAIESIVNTIEEMLRSHPEIDTGRVLYVKVVEFAPSSLDFEIYTFTKTTDWVKFQSIQQDVFLQVLKIIKDHKAECAYPTTTFNLPTSDPEKLIQKLTTH